MASRWQVKQEEREGAQQRSLTPYVPTPQPRTETEGQRRGRGSGVRNRQYELPDYLAPSPISTPSRGGTAGRGVRSKAQNPAAPAKPAIGSLPPSAAVPGTGPKGNEVGSDADPSTPGLQGDGARVNANGLVSYGRDLSSLNAFTKAFTGGYEIADIKTAFQSEDLPMKGSAGTNTDYSVDDAVAMGMSKPDALTISQGGFVETEITPSTPGTTGNNPIDAQDGTSSKPDIAESVRQLRMQRKNPRDEGSFRGFQKDNNNKMVEDAQKPEQPRSTYNDNPRRNKIRSTFLNHEGNSIQAIAAANAQAGYGKNSDGQAVFNYGGELVQAKEGMQQKAKNAAMMGKDPSEFLAIPATADTQPDTPTNSQISMTSPIKDMSEDQQKEAAQLFAKDFVSDISSKLKNK